MKASDFFHKDPLKCLTEIEEERESPPTEAQKEWTELSRKFLTAPSYTETTIYTEIDLELKRKELEEKHIIKKEIIEKKTYQEKDRLTLKPFIIKEVRRRLQYAYTEMEALQALEKEEKEVISKLKATECIRKRNMQLEVHIINQIFLPVSVIEQGAKETYIHALLLFEGIEYNGYITEKEAIPCSFKETEIFASSIKALRDRANSNLIIGEYFTDKERAVIQRVHEKPSGSPSFFSIFIVCALKIGYTFTEAIQLIRDRRNNKIL
ncbi:hypothetical protein NEFER03_0583 [Nematocida sp. LUAm3]|nr:hypothetical protein NEFER03_0583 [Nematocida sp. LUAm3]KAI5175550.1 hypothetical protein NEFER02_1456 [Nematocida sp. LUAm2]KAI5178420.1 hypothetical protein NEFER01_1567 [Nematocida sp. LUAm1]